MENPEEEWIVLWVSMYCCACSKCQNNTFTQGGNQLSKTISGVVSTMQWLHEWDFIIFLFGEFIRNEPFTFYI